MCIRDSANIALLKATNASTYDLIDCDYILIDKNGLELLNNGLSLK